MGGPGGKSVVAARRASAGRWVSAAMLAGVSSIAFASATPDGLRLTTPSGADVAWWRASEAPARWPAPGHLANAIVWQSAQPGVEHGEVAISGGGEASALRLVALRLDTRQVQLSLQWGSDAATGRPAWDVDDAPADAIVALNAGMFVDALPWGWVVSRGGELLPPGRGPLSSAVIVRRDGTVAMVDGDDVNAWRASGDVVAAFQTYPTLLSGDGVVPMALRDVASNSNAKTIDLAHRDARLALGLDRDGRLLIVLTRLDTAVPGADRLPLGLTVPEMAAVMGSLGARQAALLDGGISAQLLLRDASGKSHRWKGMRQVPLGLVARRK